MANSNHHNVLLLKELKSQSTWRLLFLSFITLSIYDAYYVKRQSGIINQHIEKTRQIPKGFVIVFYLVSCIAAFLLLPSFLADGEDLRHIELVSNIFDYIRIFMSVAWALMARSKMDKLLFDNNKENIKFSVLWCLVFSVYYFNFKINKLNKCMAEPCA
jgi:hypothetical protein